VASRPAVRPVKSVPVAVPRARRDHVAPDPLAGSLDPGCARCTCPCGFRAGTPRVTVDYLLDSRCVMAPNAVTQYYKPGQLYEQKNARGRKSCAHMYVLTAHVYVKNQYPFDDSIFRVFFRGKLNG
jgi:hypothetical protein